MEQAHRSSSTHQRWGQERQCKMLSCLSEHESNLDIGDSLDLLITVHDQGVHPSSHLDWQDHVENNSDGQLQPTHGSDDRRCNRTLRLTDLWVQPGDLWSTLYSGRLNRTIGPHTA